MSQNQVTEGRIYGGVSAEERRGARREKLLRAAEEITGTEGYGALAIEALCATAQVGIRSFYDIFGSREQLMLELYADMADEAFARAVEALDAAPAGGIEAARGAVAAVVGTIVSDPVRGRAFLLSTIGVSAELDEFRKATMDRFAALATVDALGAPMPSGADRAIWGLFLAGGINEVMVDHVLADGDRDAEVLVDNILGIYARVLAR